MNIFTADVKKTKMKKKEAGNSPFLDKLIQFMAQLYPWNYLSLSYIWFVLLTDYHKLLGLFCLFSVLSNVNMKWPSFLVNGEVTVISFGREPWSRLGFFRLWVRIPAPYTRWTFVILFVAKNYNACWKKTERGRSTTILNQSYSLIRSNAVWERGVTIFEIKFWRFLPPSFTF